MATVMFHRVVVFINDKHCRVEPEYVIVEPGEEIVFKALDTAVNLKFPVTIHFEETKVNSVHIGANNQIALHVSAGTANGVYGYEAECGVSADPFIIIHR